MTRPNAVRNSVIAPSASESTPPIAASDGSVIRWTIGRRATGSWTTGLILGVGGAVSIGLTPSVLRLRLRGAPGRRPRTERLGPRNR